jgi:YD repeat-containing protein
MRLRPAKASDSPYTTILNTWYDYHVISDGDRVEVWRGPQGGTTELVLETDAATILGSTSMALETRLCTASFDNMQFITNDPATQTMAYNGANELTSSVVGAITTTYTYDANGRTISKADGTHSARYIWFAGDKLKQYESDFPGEAGVAYNYDGLGKRRVKLVNISAPTDADYTWYRWDAGWNMMRVRRGEQHRDGVGCGGSDEILHRPARQPARHRHRPHRRRPRHRRLQPLLPRSPRHAAGDARRQQGADGAATDIALWRAHGVRGAAGGRRLHRPRVGCGS